MLTHLYY